MEFTYQSSPVLARMAAWRYIQRQVGLPLLAVVLLVAGCITAVVAGYRQWYVVAGLVAGGLVLLAWVNVYVRSDAAFRSMPDPAVTIRLDEATITFETSEHTSVMKWSRIRQVWRFPDVWLFFSYGKGAYTLIPTDVLTDDAKALIERRVTDQGGTVR
ncbi:MAG: YcxB family protein [Maioricimonas sp. JB049]